MDLISDYHSLCRKRQPDIKLEPHAFNVEELNEFLKEAYKIVRPPGHSLRRQSLISAFRTKASQTSRPISDEYAART